MKARKTAKIVLDIAMALVLVAFADYSVPLALALIRYASVAMLVAGVFHYIRKALSSVGKPRARESGTCDIP